MPEYSWLQGILTLLIAGAVLYVTWQQGRTNDLRLKLELYDRRIQVYEAVKSFLSIFPIQEIKQEHIKDLYINGSQADFLFGAEIGKYINELYKRGLHLIILNKRVETQTASENDYKKIEDELNWFSKQFDAARDKFQKYLNLSNNNQ